MKISLTLEAHCFNINQDTFAVFISMISRQGKVLNLAKTVTKKFAKYVNAQKDKDTLML
jgi:hypothetical protein